MTLSDPHSDPRGPKKHDDVIFRSDNMDFRFPWDFLHKKSPEPHTLPINRAGLIPDRPYGWSAPSFMGTSLEWIAEALLATWSVVAQGYLAKNWL